MIPVPRRSASRPVVWPRTLARAAFAELKQTTAFRDRLWVVLLLGATLGNLGLYAYVWLMQPVLPAFLPLRFNALGAVSEIGPRAVLFRMPAIGTAVLVVNVILATALHRRERLAALLLPAGALIVEGMLVLATIHVVRLAFGD